MECEKENQADKTKPEQPVSSPAAQGDAGEDWDEGALVLACLAKERTALTTLVLGYAKWIHAGAVRAYYRAGRPTSCEPRDLVHKLYLETFTDPIQLLRRFNPERPGILGPFLAKVAYHRCLKMMSTPELGSPGSVSASQSIDLSTVPDQHHTVPLDPQEVLERVLAKLSDTSREILQMRIGIGPYHVQHSVREIAKQLELSIGQVYYRMNKFAPLRRRVVATLLNDRTEDAP
jgi:DNA-directed RNA polymerase specialized sigma24 family protein